MNKENTKASNSTLTDEQYKLSDFIEEFVEFRTCEDNSRFGCDNISNNLFRSYKNGKIYFKVLRFVALIVNHGMFLLMLLKNVN